MLRRAVPFLFALACLSAAPLIAQEPVVPHAARPPQAGPRVQAAYPTYQPAIARQTNSTAASATAAAVAADRTVITISTLGLVLLVVLLVILIT